MKLLPTGNRAVFCLVCKKLVPGLTDEFYLGVLNTDYKQWHTTNAH